MTGPFPDVQGAKSRLLIALVVDNSSSMREQDAIGELNAALAAWRDEVRADANLCRIGEIALVSFGAGGEGGATVVDPSGRGRDPLPSPFVPVGEFAPPTLVASGYSPMVPAIQRALALVDRRREELAEQGIAMAYRPLVYLLTDGAPSDEDGRPSDRWRDLAQELRRQEAEQRLLFFAFGVRGADRQVLEGLAPQANYLMERNNFSLVLQAVRQSIDRVMSSGRNAPAEVVQAGVQDTVGELRELQDWFIRQTGL
ncbi:hypothetical protein [Dactylosporangium salmoneum]|uniref:VWFA domain-containing protein n=1 Tax=Dactylosporangium salmoneum TaxID=53361 RepID=A0ABN3GB71_9ACTN